MNINNFKNVLSGRTVLITGAGGGIGLETAKYFAVMGAKVLILEVNEEKGKSAEKQLNLIAQGSAKFYQIDLANESGIFKMKEYVLNKFGCP